MTPTEFADLGFSLAEELYRDAEKIYFKDYQHDLLGMFAESMRSKAKDVLNLFR